MFEGDSKPFYLREYLMYRAGLIKMQERPLLFSEVSTNIYLKWTHTLCAAMWIASELSDPVKKTSHFLRAHFTFSHDSSFLSISWALKVTKKTILESQISWFMYWEGRVKWDSSQASLVRIISRKLWIRVWGTFYFLQGLKWEKLVIRSDSTRL